MTARHQTTPAGPCAAATAAFLWSRRVACAALVAISPPSIGGCHAECNEMDAEGIGACGVGLGFARAASFEDCFCWPVIGCECEGDDCGELFVSYAECAATLRLE